MNTQTPPGIPGRSPFEDAPLDSATTADMAFSTDELSHPEYVNDDFRMFTFKVMKCPKRYVHDWRSCPFAHPTENARRRDPREVKYMPVPCPDYKRGLCLMGDACTYSHGVYECWLHPAKYRTQLCKDGGQCRRPVCFFAHSVPELRSPTYTWDGNERARSDGKQASMGLPDGAMPHAGSGPGEADAGNGAADPASLGYPPAVGKANAAGYPFQQPRDGMRQPPLQDHMGPSHGQPAYYGYPPPQAGAYREAYYPNQAIDPFTGMPIHPGLAQQHPAQASPFQVPMMGGMPGGLAGYQQGQQGGMQGMQRFHSQQLPPHQGAPHHPQRQHSGVAPAGSLASSTGGRSGNPSSDLGDLFASGGSGGTSAPRMSNAMARSLGLVPPKETRTRTLGALAGLMQGPRPAALAEGLQRPQLSYSLPAQLPDPDQQMRDVYLAAQAAAEQSGTSNQVTAQRQPSVGVPQAVIRPGSVGSMQRQASMGVPQQTPPIAPQRQSSMSLPPAMGQGTLGVPQGLQDMPQDMQGLPYNTNPQDVRAWQLGVQQGMKGLQALQQHLQAHPEAAVHKLQHELDGKSNDVLRQLQELGHDDAVMDPRQLQRLASMLSKQGGATRWPPQPLSSQTIPEAEQVTEGPEGHHLASLLQSLQAFNLQQPDTAPASTTQGQQHTASPFAASEHAPAPEVFEGAERSRSGGPRARRMGSSQRAASGSTGSAPSAPDDSLPTVGLGTQSPFASPNQQLHKLSPASSLNSQSMQRHTSSPGLP